MNAYPFKPPVVCMVCGKEIRPVYDSEKDYGMVDSGMVGKIDANYPSTHDADIYQIGLCDPCIDDLVKKGRIKMLGNYFGLDTTLVVPDSIVDIFQK